MHNKLIIHISLPLECNTLTFELKFLLECILSYVVLVYSRNQRTFRPKKSAPSGSKVGFLINISITIFMLYCT